VNSDTAAGSRERGVAAVDRVRWIAKIEGVSFLVLLGIAMPLKYAAGLPMAVKIVGWAHGVLLDVGCGVKPFEQVFAPYVEKYVGIEYSPESGYRGNKADICGDAGYLPFADASVDTILCTEVMEHVPDPERTIAEFARVLRPGGTLITTAPFVYPIHDAYDFFRYSPDGLAVMMKRHGLTIEKVEPLSGTAITIASMFNLYWFDIGFMWTKWLYPIGLLFRPLLWLLCFAVNILGGLFDKIVPSKHLAFNHLTIARK
jgi:SAM-dependent methyltransferase